MFCHFVPATELANTESQSVSIDWCYLPRHASSSQSALTVSTESDLPLGMTATMYRTLSTDSGTPLAGLLPFHYHAVSRKHHNPTTEHSGRIEHSSRIVGSKPWSSQTNDLQN